MRLRSMLLLVAATVLCSAAPAAAAWISPDAADFAPPAVRAAGPDAAVTLDFAVPGFDLETVEIDGRTYSRLGLPGQAWHMERGLPELPVISRSVAIRGEGVPVLRVLDQEWIEMAAAPPVPSKGPLTRDIDPAGVPYVFDALYAGGGVHPALTVELGAPFIVRDLRGVSVRVTPFQYDYDRGVLRVLRSLTVRVDVAGSGGENVKSVRPREIDPAFARMYDGLFENYGADKYAPIGRPGRLLVVCADAYQGAIQPFVAWKQQKGLPVELITTSSVGGTAAGIQGAIDARFDAPAGLTYVVLVGDIADVPTNVGTVESADSDGTYAMVAGTDLYPDLFISRISGQNAAQITQQVDKFVRYERNPDTGAAADWYARATGLASNEGSPTDYERCNLLRDDLLAYGFTQVDQIYQPTGTTAMITAALNEGRSLINYIGHGSGTSWGNPPFAVADVHALANGWAQPWILDVSCSNGDFSLSECFAEAWLRAGSASQPAGAVASYSASTLASWVPPCVMQTHAVDLLVTEQANELGTLYFYGGMQVLDDYPGATGEGAKLIEQYNIFGDCSLMVRTAAPTGLSPVHMPVVHIGATSFAVDVGVAGAMVCLWSEGVIHGVGTTDAGGSVVVQLDSPLLEPGTVTLTVTGYNLETYQAALQAITPAAVTLDPAAVDAAVPTDVRVTVLGADGVTPVVGLDVWAEGFGYASAVAQTGAGGVAIVSVDAPYGPSVEIVGRDPAESFDLFRAELIVNAVALTMPDLTVATDIGMTDQFPLNLPGTLIAAVGEAGAALRAILPDGTIVGGKSLALVLTPAELGQVVGVIALAGYNLYTETFDVIEAYGQLTGTVASGGVPVAGAVVRVLDGLGVEAFAATTDAAGAWDLGTDVLVAGYTLVVDHFGHLHYETPFFVNYGANTHDIELASAPSGILSGVVTDAGTGVYLGATVRVYRSDDGSLFDETTSDPATGQFATGALPFFVYDVQVRAVHHTPLTAQVEIDAESVLKDFVLTETQGDILVIDDAAAARALPDKYDEKGDLLAAGGVVPAGRSAAELSAELEALGYGVTLTTSATTDPADWDLYDLVVIASGTNTASLDDAALRTALIAYVAGGGKLLIEGGEVAYDHYASGAFAAQVLHTTDWNHDASGSLQAGLPTHALMTTPNPINGPLTLSYSSYGDQDAVVPLADAQLVGIWSTYPTDGGVIAYDPNPAPQGGQIVFYTFNYAALAAPARTDLLENTVVWLLTEETGTSGLSGTVTLQGMSNHSGVLVEVLPGGGSMLTDAAGAFSFDGLFAGEYTVRASRDQWSVDVASVTLVDGAVTTGVELHLTPVHELEVCSSPALAIPDNTPAGVSDAVDMILGTGELVTSVAVYVDVTHTWQGDLIVDLVAPSGATCRLHDRTGSSADDILGWYPGELVPAEDLGALAGEALDGSWTLRISDNAGSDVGTLNGWCLKIVYGGGTTAAGDLPAAATLAQNHPNPFNPRTRIAFTTPRDGRVSLRVYDLAGRLVRTLVDRELPADAYSLEWDGRRDDGRQAPSGTYHYRLDAAGVVTSRKMMLVK